MHFGEWVTAVIAGLPPFLWQESLSAISWHDSISFLFFLWWYSSIYLLFDTKDELVNTQVSNHCLDNEKLHGTIGDHILNNTPCIIFKSLKLLQTLRLISILFPHILISGNISCNVSLFKKKIMSCVVHRNNYSL